MSPARAVLGGGSSRRMGADKVMFDVDGVPMGLRVAQALGLADGHQVHLVGGSPNTAALLELSHIPDRLPGEGPLVGVWSALEYLGSDVIVAACDLAMVDSATVEAFCSTEMDGFEAAVAVVDGRWQPSLARWNRSALVRVAAAIEAGERSLLLMLSELDVAEIHCDAGKMVNVNRLADLPKAAQHKCPDNR